MKRELHIPEWVHTAAVVAAVVILILALASCGTLPTRERYDQFVRSCIGQDADTLAMRIGVPAKTQPTADGGRLMEYDKQYAIEGVPFSCQTIFRVNAQNVVTDVSSLGNGCSAR